jgi:hypothetical protein
VNRLRVEVTVETVSAAAGEAGEDSGEAPPAAVRVGRAREERGGLKGEGGTLTLGEGAADVGRAPEEKGEEGVVGVRAPVSAGRSCS